MSAEAPAWPVLGLRAWRLLGVLVEKQKTTDTYPLTLNALEAGCNQKSNRDPMLELDPAGIEETLTELQKQGLVMRVISGRVDKWKHQLYEAWSVSSIELAVLAELLLRGPQTEGELRARASRMDDIADQNALREILGPMKERGLAVCLTPEGRRGTIWAHGFHEPGEVERFRMHGAAIKADAAVPEIDSQRAESEMAALQRMVEELRTGAASLAARVDRLERELGLAAPHAS
jgi:uncharacterized protein YceH (UPF0502 family)